MRPAWLFRRAVSPCLPLPQPTVPGAVVPGDGGRRAAHLPFVPSRSAPPCCALKHAFSRRESRAKSTAADVQQHAGTDRVERHKQLRLNEVAATGAPLFPRFAPGEAGEPPLSCFAVLRKLGEDLAPGDVRWDALYSIAGRVVGRPYTSSKLLFYTLQQGDQKLQVVASRQRLPDVDQQTWKAGHHYLRKGDFIRFIGSLGRTKSGEVSLYSTRMPSLLAPMLALPPEVYVDVRERHRNRHIDMLVNPRVLEILRKRAEIIRCVRRFFDERGFLEVETPILTAMPGGAVARPFLTRSEGLEDHQLALRIAPELHLKRLVIGGLDRVYEIGKQFRNEGMDQDHSPEFTTCEFYQAYASVESLMVTTEDLMTSLVKDVCGSSTVPAPTSTTPVKMGRESTSDDTQSACASETTEADADMVPLEFTPPFRRLNVLEELEARVGKEFPADLGSEESAQWLVQVCEDHGVPVVPPVTVPRLLDRMISHWIEPKCIQPTFLYGHPTVMSPLAKSDVDAKGRSVSCRFELFVGGKEIVNAYEELNDPDEQRRRFTNQMKDRGKGDVDSQLPDEEFCQALEFGLPPTGGAGMGIDRMVQLLTGMASIKEVVAFPMVRQLQK